MTVRKAAARTLRLRGVGLPLDLEERRVQHEPRGKPGYLRVPQRGTQRGSEHPGTGGLRNVT